jgi:hypothetical protein
LTILQSIDYANRNKTGEITVGGSIEQIAINRDEHQRIKWLYDHGKLDENDIDSLDKLKRDIIDIYSKGDK